jgi:hypothetical protein
MRRSRLLIIIAGWEALVGGFLFTKSFTLAGILVLGIALQRVLSAIEPEHSWPMAAGGLAIRFGILVWLPWSGLESWQLMLVGLESAVWIPIFWKLLK